jgi:hypothetical protein
MGFGTPRWSDWIYTTPLQWDSQVVLTRWAVAEDCPSERELTQAVAIVAAESQGDFRNFYPQAPLCARLADMASRPTAYGGLDDLVTPVGPPRTRTPAPYSNRWGGWCASPTTSSSSEQSASPELERHRERHAAGAEMTKRPARGLRSRDR